MVEKIPLQSEGEQLESFLDELQKDQQIKEIAGWETGFPNLSRALDGIRPGLYLLIGPPACGKTSFAKQLLDQVARQNAVPGVFFSFAESEKELRIRTLARLSGIENREIRRGSAYLLHWYGVPKAQHTDHERLPPSWDKLKRSAEEAQTWLDLIYLIECDRNTDLRRIEDRIREVESIKGTDRVMVVIDDCQRLGSSEQNFAARIAVVTEELQRAAVNLQLAILAVCPDLREERSSLPQIWSDRAPGADVILVMEIDLARTKKLTEPNQAITLNIVKNRGGEKGKLAFEFVPAFSKFAELAPAQT
ncbi:MAG TPA: DnaB-like helicase C-terminal domain-containing protein [Candidatus Binatia bacterium]|nr:DnaB-like helicase C-terminal domain-containing protein [Candidatus Binatia bacterium]